MLESVATSTRHYFHFNFLLLWHSKNPQIWDLCQSRNRVTRFDQSLSCHFWQKFLKPPCMRNWWTTLSQTFVRTNTVLKLRYTLDVTEKGDFWDWLNNYWVAAGTQVATWVSLLWKWKGLTLENWKDCIRANKKQTRTVVVLGRLSVFKNINNSGITIPPLYHQINQKINLPGDSEVKHTRKFKKKSRKNPLCFRGMENGDAFNVLSFCLLWSHVGGRSKADSGGGGGAWMKNAKKVKKWKQTRTSWLSITSKFFSFFFKLKKNWNARRLY